MFYCSANGFNFVRFDGSMTTKARTEAIEAFSNPCPGSPTIFLMSLKAGGVGINLTAASRVFLIDPVRLFFIHCIVTDHFPIWL